MSAKNKKIVKYKFAFKYGFESKNEKLVYSIFAIDKNNKMQELFLINNIRMLEKDLNCDLIMLLKTLSENYVKNKYPNYESALKGGLFFGKICIYPKWFIYNV